MPLGLEVHLLLTRQSRHWDLCVKAELLVEITSDKEFWGTAFDFGLLILLTVLLVFSRRRETGQ